MLSERLGEIGMRIRSDRHTGYSTLCSLAGGRSRLLHNLIDIDRDTITAEIFGTLKPSIGRSHAKVRLENFDVARTTAGIFLVEFLNLKSHTELIDSSSSSITISNSNQTRISQIITKLRNSSNTYRTVQIRRRRNCRTNRRTKSTTLDSQR